MDTGEVRPPKNIIKDPDWIEDVKSKFQEKEKREIEEAFKRRNVESMTQLEQVAIETVQQQLSKSDSEKKPLKDHTIRVEPQSEEIKSLRQKLNEEITAFARERLRHVQTPEGAEGLKGRVTQGSPERPKQTSGAE